MPASLEHRLGERNYSSIGLHRPRQADLIENQEGDNQCRKSLGRL
jgi:hypothetical protein